MAYIDYQGKTTIEVGGRITGVARLRNNISELVIESIRGDEGFESMLKIINARTAKLKDVSSMNEDSLIDIISRIIMLPMDEKQLRKLERCFKKIVRHEKSTYNGNQFYMLIMESGLPFRHELLFDGSLNDPYYNNRGNAVDHFISSLSEKYPTSSKGINHSYILRKMLRGEFERGGMYLEDDDKEKLIRIFTCSRRMENHGQYKALWLLLYFGEADNLSHVISSKIREVMDDLRRFLSRNLYKDKSDTNMTGRLDLIIFMLKSLLQMKYVDQALIYETIRSSEELKVLDHISESDMDSYDYKIKSFHSSLTYAKAMIPISIVTL